MEDIRSYESDLDDTLRQLDDSASEREFVAEDDEVPFDIPRD